MQADRCTVPARESDAVAIGGDMLKPFQTAMAVGAVAHEVSRRRGANSVEGWPQGAARVAERGGDVRQDIAGAWNDGHGLPSQLVVARLSSMWSTRDGRRSGMAGAPPRQERLSPRGGTCQRGGGRRGDTSAEPSTSVPAPARPQLCQAPPPLCTTVSASALETATTALPRPLQQQRAAAGW